MTSSERDTRRSEAYRRYQTGDAVGAAELCQTILESDASCTEAIYLLGVLAVDTGQLEVARAHFNRVLQQAPGNAIYANALGEVQFRLGAIEEARKCFEQALTSQPTYARAHNNLGRLAHGQGELAQARARFEEALRLNPQYATAHNNLGAVLLAQQQPDAAAECFCRALQFQPDYPEASSNLGSILYSQGDPAAARRHFEHAIRIRPNYPRALHGLGQALEALGELPAAVGCYREAVRLNSDFVEAFESLGNLLVLQPDLEGAQQALEGALALKRDNAYAFSRLAVVRQLLCDWRQYDADVSRLWADAQQHLAVNKVTPVLPFTAQTLPWTGEQMLAVARSHSESIARDVAKLAKKLNFSTQQTRTTRDRLRVGYLSSDFRDHPVSHLIQAVFGYHDRTRFEVFAYSFGPDDRSSYRQRIARDCDQFRDLCGLSITDAARAIHADQLQILVDLQGHTGFSKMSLMALRPVSIQINFLGQPGTTGADFIDYVLGDAIVCPLGDEAHFSEKILRVPHCYQATDDQQPIAKLDLSRRHHGLPEQAVVFCAFNTCYKIEPTVFAVWMRILHSVPGSVLWLSPMAEAAQQNLRREAEARGIRSERLVFANWANKAAHLARHQLADLYLDTFLYNGHTSVSDSLWAGLPVLSCPGNTFASRVGASLLTAIGMPELIMKTPQHYEFTAVQLARNPDKLRDVRQRLAEKRLSTPLFNTERFVRDLEDCYALAGEHFRRVTTTLV